MENVTYIKTAHEEGYSDNSKTLGVLTNWNTFGEKIDSFTYIYNEGIYIFFDTIIDMNDYLLYADKKTKRAYMNENDFDILYDKPFKNTFNDHLEWFN